MNIIELYEKLSFGKSELQDLTDEKRRTIENRLLEINTTHTDTTIATDLEEVLKNHPNEFLFVINTREWYNFLLKPITVKTSSHFTTIWQQIMTRCRSL